MRKMYAKIKSQLTYPLPKSSFINGYWRMNLRTWVGDWNWLNRILTRVRAISFLAAVSSFLFCIKSWTSGRQELGEWLTDLILIWQTRAHIRETWYWTIWVIHCFGSGRFFQTKRDTSYFLRQFWSLIIFFTIPIGGTISSISFSVRKTNTSPSIKFSRKILLRFLIAVPLYSQRYRYTESAELARITKTYSHVPQQITWVDYRPGTCRMR